jgi:bifunctional non-homologous end joining protein LigD
MPRETRLPKHLQPMLAILTDASFDDPGWVFESKWDGFRMVAGIEHGRVTLYSRNGKIVSESYRQVAQALEKVKADAVLDGELVALDENGISRFQLLQNALRAQAALRYYLFDLMFLDGKDLRLLPLRARKEKLRGILPKHPLLAYSAHRPECGTKYFKEAETHGLEGIMAKRAVSPYLSGQRSGDWLKIKTARRQEVVIAGFTAPRRTRPCFGSLVLAVREALPGAMSGVRHRHQPRRATPALRPDATVANQPLPIQAADQGRGCHELGEAEAGGRSQVHGMDGGRRDATPLLPRRARGQATSGRCP